MCAYHKAILTIGMQWHAMSLCTIWFTVSEIKPRIYAKCGWEFQNARPKYLYKQIFASAKVLIKILNPNLPVFLLCEILKPTHKSIYFVWKQKFKYNKLFSVVFHVKRDDSKQLVKQHDNLRRFPMQRL